MSTTWRKWLAAALVAAFAAVLAGGPAAAQDGLVATDLGGNDWARVGLIQMPSGRIVSAGISSWEDGGFFAAVAHFGDGTRDWAFGSGGATLVQFCDDMTSLTSAAAQSDGRMILCGWAMYDVPRRHDTRFALTRLNTDGTLDKSFGRKGKLTTQFRTDTWSFATKVLVQPDDRVIAVGYSEGFPTRKNVPVPDQIAMARYLPDGRLDSEFGERGLVQFEVPHGPTVSRVEINTAALQNDGKILAGGWTRNNFEDGFENYLLVRFHSDGSVDETFGVDGIIELDVGNMYEVYVDVALQDDGRIVALGQQQPSEWSTDAITLMRFDSQGWPDDSFGSGGIVIDDLFDDPADKEAMRSIAIQPDGKILVGGAHLYEDTSDGTAQQEGFLIRYTVDGMRDTTFGNLNDVPGFEGVVLGPAGAVFQDVLVRPEIEDILVVGYSGLDFALCRYFSDGTLDLLFGGTP
jgi:uncharacterized delta-60 repeat protein